MKGKRVEHGGAARTFSRGDFLKGLAAASFLASGGLAVSGQEALALGAHGGYKDAITHESCAVVTDFARWLSGSRGYIGELGIPSGDDQARWATMFDTYLDVCDRHSMHVTVQKTSETYWKIPSGGAFDAIHLCPGDRVHKVVDRPGYQAAVVEKHNQFKNAAGQMVRRGFNFSGGQNWINDREAEAQGIETWNNAYNGSYGENWWYPTVPGATGNPISASTGKNSFGYLYSRGVRLVRIGYRMERVQPRLGGNLDTAELNRLKQCMANARAAGLEVVLDCHNYGGYYETSGRKPLNTSGFPVSMLVNHWQRMSAEFASDRAVVMYDIMNEPQNDGGIVADSGSGEKAEAQAWERISREVVGAIRARSDSAQCVVPLYRGIEYHLNGPWISGNVTYTIHKYPAGGRAEYTYAEANSEAASRGY